MKNRVMGWEVVAVMCALGVTAGCKREKSAAEVAREKAEAQRSLRAKNRAPAPPTAPAVVTLDRLRPEDQLPPPEPGYVRIEEFDVDAKGVAAEGNGTYADVIDTADAHVDGGACTVHLELLGALPRDPDSYFDYVDAPAKLNVLRKETRPNGWVLQYSEEGGTREEVVVGGPLGRHQFLCSSRVKAPSEAACVVDVCGSLRVVTGGALDRPLPDRHYVIHMSSTTHGRSSPHTTVSISLDGSIEFTGPTCRRFREVTGKIDRARVTALIDAFRTAKFASIEGDPIAVPYRTGTEKDDWDSLRATINDEERYIPRWRHPENMDATFEALRRWVIATVGENPCAPHT